MRKAEVTVLIMHVKGLNIFEFARSACRGVAIVRNGSVACQVLGEKLWILKYLQYQAMVFMNGKSPCTCLTVRIGTGHQDPRCFLASMLQRMQSVIRHDGCFRVVVHPNNATMADGPIHILRRVASRSLGAVKIGRKVESVI